MSKIPPNKKENHKNKTEPLIQKMKPQLKPIPKTNSTTEEYIPPFIKNIYQTIQTYPKLSLLVVYFLLLVFPFGYNILPGNVLLRGEESYYHLTQAQTVTIHNWQYSPLHLVLQYLPLNALALLPLVLGLLTLFCTYAILEKIKIPLPTRILFLTLFITSPLFLYSYRTLSSSGLFLTLVSLGFFLLWNKNNNRYLSYLSLLPFLFATSIDGANTLFLLFLLSVIYFVTYFATKNQTKNNSTPIQPVIPLPPRIIYPLLLLISLSFILHQTFLSQPLFIGPFAQQNSVNDLITDFGAIQGMSIFTALLGLIGFILLRKQHCLFYSTLLFIIIAIVAYIYNTAAFFIIGLWFIFLSTIALLHLIERSWTLPKLKEFTILVIILGILFTTLTYSIRLSTLPPTSADVEVLTWVKQTTPQHQIIFTSPTLGNYVSYYSKRPVVSTLQNTAEIRGNLTQKIYHAAYVTELFPLLEGYDISLIYITPQMRKTLPPDQNLLFLLKNERFKLIYSTQNTEMWLFTNKSSTTE